MPSITNIITLAFLATAASAMPANVARQHSTDCEKDTSYFACGPYNGCFDHDPCVEPYTPTSGETPDHTKEAKPSTTTTAASKVNTITPEVIYDIYPEHPDYSKKPVHGVHIETYNNKSQVEQAIVYKGIPAGAKNCGFGWMQGDRHGRTFLVKNGNALAGIRQLSGFPKDGEDVSYNSIKPFDDAEKELGANDFSNWDTADAQPHGAGSVKCAETLYFKAGFRNPEGDSQVYLEQDDKNGWVITYNL
ncbi:hypothetical protein FSARC_7503 [Fusarium sarcochroum]|uniref:Uncharacterized protein n=1 Tax=Fusarium sarcochroum TaxID=1208366 RepID=A0A8H4TV64_9HYPO|nr:hypothetical protein FSARC_7503 [Fusarium sarcochroum]